MGKEVEQKLREQDVELHAVVGAVKAVRAATHLVRIDESAAVLAAEVGHPAREGAHWQVALGREVAFGLRGAHRRGRHEEEAHAARTRQPREHRSQLHCPHGRTEQGRMSGDKQS